MKGIVWTGALEVRDDVEVRDPRPHEVRVRIANAGLCHSDVTRRSTAPSRSRPRSCSATRARAWSSEVGDAVTKVEVGDHVVLTTLGNCGQLRRLRPRPADPLPRHDRAACRGRSPWAARRRSSSPTPACSPRTVVVNETQAVVIDPDVPLDRRLPHRLRGRHRRRAPCSTGPRSQPRPVGRGHRRRRHRPERHPGLPASPPPADHRRRHQPGQGGGRPPVRRHPLHRRAGPPSTPSPPSRRSARTASTTRSSASATPPSSARRIDLLDWGGTLRAARRAQARHRGQLRRQRPLQRQVDPGLPLRRRPGRTTTSRCSSSSTRPAGC